MQKFSPIIILCVVLAVAMAQPIPEEPPSTPSEVDMMESFEKTPKIIEARELKRPSLGEITDRLVSAVRLTVKDERTAIAQAVQEMLSAARQSVKAGVSAAQAGFQIFLALPSVGRNILIDTEAIQKELAQPDQAAL